MATDNASGDFRTPRARVVGLGLGHGHATWHFVGQRISGIAAIPLCFILLYTVYNGFFAPYEQALATVRHPAVAVSLILFTGVALYHMKLGMSMVLTDYIHCKASQVVSLILNLFFCMGVGAAMAYALARILFGSAS